MKRDIKIKKNRLLLSVTKQVVYLKGIKVVAIGSQAGYSNQNQYSVAIGRLAGQISQEYDSVCNWFASRSD